jgi:hypothetical protein
MPSFNCAWPPTSARHCNTAQKACVRWYLGAENRLIRDTSRDTVSNMPVYSRYAFALIRLMTRQPIPEPTAPHSPTEWRSSDCKTKPLPPDPARHQNSAIAPRARARETAHSAYLRGYRVGLLATAKKSNHFYARAREGLHSVHKGPRGAAGRSDLKPKRFFLSANPCSLRHA